MKYFRAAGAIAAFLIFFLPYSAVGQEKGLLLKQEVWGWVGFPEQGNPTTQFSSSTFLGHRGVLGGKPKLHILMVCTPENVFQEGQALNLIGVIVNYPLSLNDGATLAMNAGATFSFSGGAQFRSWRGIINVGGPRLQGRVIADVNGEGLLFLGVHSFYKLHTWGKGSKFLALGAGINAPRTPSGGRAGVPVIGLQIFL